MWGFFSLESWFFLQMKASASRLDWLEENSYFSQNRFFLRLSLCNRT